MTANNTMNSFILNLTACGEESSKSRELEVKLNENFILLGLLYSPSPDRCSMINIKERNKKHIDGDRKKIKVVVVGVMISAECRRIGMNECHDLDSSRENICVNHERTSYTLKMENPET